MQCFLTFMLDYNYIRIKNQDYNKNCKFLFFENLSTVTLKIVVLNLLCIHSKVFSENVLNCAINFRAG